MAAAPEIRFVSSVGRDNWLLVALNAGPRVSLPYGLKVRVIEVKDGREHFEILEGVNKGQRATVSLKGSGQSYLVKDMTRENAGTIRFNLKAQALWYGSNGPIQAFSGAFQGFTAVTPGTYDLQIPAYPHAQTRPEYGLFTPFHNTWFRLGLSATGSRFLHVGEISEGCVTVRAFQFDPAEVPRAGFSDLPNLANNVPGALGMPYPAKLPPLGSWTDVYNYLICRRASDQSVGKLIVT
jgi:hypothetical protein